jgi:glyoxylase I family protein
MSGFPTLTHVALTVRDLDVSEPWYRALIGSDPAIDEDTDGGFHHIVFTLDSGTLLGLHEHEHRTDGEFSEFRLGLDHVSFGCENRTELEKWAERLDELGIEHGGILDADYGSGLSFRDPDGIALEFFCTPS